MHENKRANAARTTWPLSLLLAASTCATPVLAQAPGAAAPKAGAAPSAATAPSAAPAASAAPAPSAAPAAAAKPAAAASAKPKRKLPMRACPAKVPAELNPPPDVTLETVLPASGVQSYACGIEKLGEAPDWQPKGPHAMLGEPNNLMGIHFGGPSWQAMDGSLVKGTKISSAGAPDKSAIVWLLLSGAATGEGIFGNITHIQRMDTVGGKPPQGGCDASHLDTRVLVPYRTNYYFYREALEGEKVRQCRGEPKPVAEEKSGKPKPVGAKPAVEKAATDKTAARPAADKAAKASTGTSTAGTLAAEKSPADKSPADKSPAEKGAATKAAATKSAAPPSASTQSAGDKAAPADKSN